MYLRNISLIVSVGLLLSACGDKSPAQHWEQGASETVGNLGGVPVRIPREFARNVEYDGDPAILQPRLTSPPKRTFASSIRSFGFDFRYPDLVGIGSEEARQEKASRLPGNTSWIFAGVNAGEDYTGAGSIDRIASGTISTREPATGGTYQLSADRICGLETYVLTGKDNQGVATREHSSANDIFVARASSGTATTFIRCSNRSHNAAPCTHYFDLGSPMDSIVYLQYRRGLLCDWQGIQNGASQLFYGFRAAAEGVEGTGK